MRKTLASSLFLVFIAICTSAQNIPTELLEKTWHSYWISVPEASEADYGVYLFRKSFELETVPESFVIHVSGDNRYKLFVNGSLLGLGPARGDFYFWNYETIDIGKYLKKGKNTVAAVVWNEGPSRPEAQITFRTGFILQGNSATEEVVNTNRSWLCIQDKSYHPLPVNVPGYYVAGPGQLVDMAQNIKGWTLSDFNDGSWKNARQLMPGTPKGAFNFSYGWMLVPSSLPAMELRMQRLDTLRRAVGVTVPHVFPKEKTPVTIPANTKATLLLDQTYLTNAYLTFVVSKGKSAGISIQYAEALYIGDHHKGNRNEVEGKQFIGKKDSITCDGTAHQVFSTLWWRTYRYIQINIQTREEPLIIDDLYGIFTGYPFQNHSTFFSTEADLQSILDIGWRTARLCAFETYMDCPYYEQLQYVGDTRIQALVSLYNSGDDRLMRNAITQLDHSRMAEGITQSRYPTANSQQIPTFSLWWIGMVYDYWKYRPDIDFVKDKLPGTRQVLAFFQHYQQSDGSLRNLPYWIFTDWSEGKNWWAGVAPIGTEGNSAVLDLQLMWTYQIAAELENQLGMKAYADEYLTRAAQLKNTIQQKYWDATKGLYADTPEKKLFSQHANTLAILSDMVSGKQASDLGQKLLTDSSMVQATIYFKYYLHQALVKAGYGNNYLHWLGIWKENIREGLTTWAEISNITAARSDCHAWGASPNIELFRIVLGIDSNAPGFSKIKIEPHLGDLKVANGAIPHPNGIIKASYQLKDNKWFIVIDLPTNTPGDLIWQGKEYDLAPGENKFELKP